MKTVLAFPLLVCAATLGMGCGSADCSESRTCAEESPLGSDGGSGGGSGLLPSGGGSSVEPDAMNPSGVSDAGSTTTEEPTGTEGQSDASLTIDGDAGMGSGSVTDGGSGGSSGGDSGSKPEGGSGTDGGSGGGAGSGAEGGSGGSGLCSDPGAQCVEAPAGWNGPIVLVSASGDTPPPCPSIAPTTDFQGFTGLNAASADCDCTCTDPEPEQLSCGTVTVSSAFIECSATPTERASVEPGGCSPFDSALPTSNAAWIVSDSEFGASGNCTPEPSEDVPEITWDVAHRACDLTQSCGAGTCVPDLTGSGRLCVYVDDDASCPAGFPDLVEFASGVSDTRDCTACTCGDIEGSCTGTVRIQDDACVGYAAPMAEIELGYCGAPQGSPVYPYTLRTNIVAEGSCQASNSTATGSATETGLRTVCCAAP